MNKQNLVNISPESNNAGKKQAIGCWIVAAPVIIILVVFIFSMLLPDKKEPLTLKEELQHATGTVVLTSLKYPDTANFPALSKWTFGESDELYSISSYVESDNSLGIKVTERFTVKFDRETMEIVFYQLGDAVVIDDI